MSARVASALDDVLRAHPCYDRCVRLLRNGLADWNGSFAIQNAAKTLGMDRRAYCMARLSANQFQWTSAGTGEPFTQMHLQLAWRDVLASASVATHERTHDE